MTITELPPPDLEARLADLDTRLRAVEGRASVPARPRPAPERRPTGERPVPPHGPVAGTETTAPRTAPRPPRPARDLERLLGGRVLAWVGAVAVLAGLAMLFALGISEGWLDPTARVALGAAASAVLVGAGGWLHARHGRTDAARAAAAAGFGGLFLADTVATRGYELIAPEVGLALAALVAVATAVVAIRWRAQVVGAIGIVGALLAPPLAGLPFGGGTTIFLLLAAAGATFVLLYERWSWLALAVLAIPAAQWTGPLVWGDGSWSAPGMVAVLVAFGAVNVVAALGVELRTRRLDIRTPAAYLLALNAALLAIVGSAALTDVDGRDAAALWLFALAAAHVAGGLAVRGHARSLANLAFALATVVANLGLIGADLDPTVRIVLWAASAIGMAVLARNGRTIPDALVGCGLGGQLALAALATFMQLRQGGLHEDPALAVALGALAAGCLVSGRLTGERASWRIVLDSAGLLAVAALGVAAFSGVELTLAWAALAVALARLAQRTGDDVTSTASALFLAGAAGWCLIDQAPPTALLDGHVALGTAAIGLAAVVAALALVRRTAGEPERSILTAGIAVTALYLASIAVVAVTSSGASAASGGQLALSALWALVGVIALVTGLRLRRRTVRVAALALLSLTIAKVFLFDLATLTALARVGSFLALGVLLLLAAFAYQRLRPEVPAPVS